MNWLIEFFLGSALGYIAATWCESYLHQNVQHASKQVRSFWKKHPRVFRPFLDAYFSHAVVHHRWTYRKGFVRQFEDADERAAVDKRLLGRGDLGSLIIAERYGVSLVGRGLLKFMLPTMPMYALVYGVLGLPGLLGALPMLALSPAASKWLHPFIHRRHEEAILQAPQLTSWLLCRKLVQRIIINHWIHHDQPNCNFNLVPGGDWIRGVYQLPTPEQLTRMCVDGMPVRAIDSATK